MSDILIFLGGDSRAAHTVSTGQSTMTFYSPAAIRDDARRELTSACTGGVDRLTVALRCWFGIAYQIACVGEWTEVRVVASAGEFIPPERVMRVGHWDFSLERLDPRHSIRVATGERLIVPVDHAHEATLSRLMDVLRELPSDAVFAVLNALGRPSLQAQLDDICDRLGRIEVHVSATTRAGTQGSLPTQSAESPALRAPILRSRRRMILVGAAVVAATLVAMTLVALVMTFMHAPTDEPRARDLAGPQESGAAVTLDGGGLLTTPTTSAAASESGPASRDAGE